MACQTCGRQEWHTNDCDENHDPCLTLVWLRDELRDLVSALDSVDDRHPSEAARVLDEMADRARQLYVRAVGRLWKAQEHEDAAADYPGFPQ